MTQDTQTAAPGVSVEAMAFRKKPVVITAVQMTKEVAAAYLFEKKPLPDGVEFASASHNNGKINNFHAYIETLEGRMAVSIGDWIITGVKGERYPCKPDIFEMTYESAAPPPPVGELQGVTTEIVAKMIYETWKECPEYRSWQDGGNSLKQDEARKVAGQILAASRPAAPQAAVDAGPLSKSEQEAVLKDLRGLECLINRHDCWEVEADAMGADECSPHHQKRIAELLAMGRAIIAEDPDCWSDEQKEPFKLRWSESTGEGAQS